MGNSVEYFDSELVQHVIFTPEEQIVLNTINQQVIGKETLGDILDFLFRSTQNVCPCDRLAMAFVEEGTDRIVSDEVRTNYDKILMASGYAEDLTISSLQRVLRQDQVRLIPDLPAYAEEHPESRSSAIMLKEGIRSSLTCPVRVNDKNVGVLFRSSTRARAYDNRSVGMHLAVTERISRAVERAYNAAKATEAHNAYMEMLGFVTHELKSPVSSIIMDANMLVNGYLGDLNDKQEQRIGRMVSRGKYLLNLIGEYLNLSRMESGQLKLSSRVEAKIVDDLIEPALDVIGDQVHQRQMTLEQEIDLDGIETVECDPDLMRIVIVNFLSNAAKYGRLHGTIWVKVKRTEDRWQFSVRNEGQGFTAEERFKLFHKFSRLDDPELKRQKGTGVGLYTVWRIVQLHGGRVDARSEHGHWAEFSIDIPQPLPEAPQEITDEPAIAQAE